jgi:hypothetical protein
MGDGTTVLLGGLHDVVNAINRSRQQVSKRFARTSIISIYHLTSLEATAAE